MKKNKLIPASEYCKSVFDGTHDTPKPCTKGHKLLTSKNILNGELDKTNAYYISEEDYNAINIRSKVHQNDILFSMIGSVGNVCLIKENDSAIDFAIKNMGVLSCGEKEKAVFLYYYLQSPFAKKTIESYLNGAVQKFLGLERLRTFPVPEYSDDMQKIAAVLSALDDKIALNRRMNAKLEQMAKRLYDHWFVQFDFPVPCHSELVSESHNKEMLNQVQHDERTKPYKSSGGKMVWNETLKREIPAGWEVKSVNDISTSYRGVGYTADDEKSAEDNDVVLILRGNNISNNHIIYDGNTVYLDKSFVSEEQKIHKYDFVMTMSSGSKEHVGKSAMFLFDSPHSYGAFCNKITPAKDCQFFLENYLHSEYFKKYIQITCSGTGINNLTNEHFDKAFFSFPDNEVLESFNQKINPIYEQIGVLEKENLRLIALRDKLLPLLMNGQVEVN